jgi:hypothetical protein
MILLHNVLNKSTAFCQTFLQLFSTHKRRRIYARTHTHALTRSSLLNTFLAHAHARLSFKAEICISFRALYLSKQKFASLLEHFIFSSKKLGDVFARPEI